MNSNCSARTSPGASQRFAKRPLRPPFSPSSIQGVENTLRRLSRFHGLVLLEGESWHVELFKRFSSDAHPPLPKLFDEAFELKMGSYRRFRHVVHHGYGFQIDWGRMRQGVDEAGAILSEFESRTAAHLETL